MIFNNDKEFFMPKKPTVTVGGGSTTGAVNFIDFDKLPNKNFYVGGVIKINNRKHKKDSLKLKIKNNMRKFK